VELSLVYELETNDNSPEGVNRVYREALEQIKLADELGFRTAWFTEHHFLDRFSFSSAPEVFFGYLAAQTKQIRLGHAIVLLPFAINHPIRVAERSPYSTFCPTDGLSSAGVGPSPRESCPPSTSTPT